MNLPTEIRTLKVKTIPHSEQRYDTVGDYEIEGTYLHLVVSDMGDWRFGFACAIHEQIEAALQVAHGKEDRSTEFDKIYEDARQELIRPMSIRTTIIGPAEAVYRAEWECECLIDADSEPGEDVHAPYHAEHMVADNIERIVLRELGAEWGDYAAAVAKLEYHPKEAHHAYD